MAEPMDQYKGITIESGFKYPAAKPLDVRFVAKTREMAQKLIDDGNAYPGLTIWVKKWKNDNETEETDVQVQCVPKNGNLELVRIANTSEDFKNGIAPLITKISGGNAATW